MTTPAIPEDMLQLYLRKVAWDLLPCAMAQVFMQTIGLVPSSEEGAEIEHRESHKRLKLTDGLDDLIAEYSALSARVLSALALNLPMNTEIQPEVVEMVVGQFTQTIHCGATVTIANLIDQGYLQPGPKVAR